MQIKEDSGLPEDSSWLHDHSRLLNKGCCWLAGVLRDQWLLEGKAGEGGGMCRFVLGSHFLAKHLGLAQG